MNTACIRGATLASVMEVSNQRFRGTAPPHRAVVGLCLVGSWVGVVPDMGAAQEAARTGPSTAAHESLAAGSHQPSMRTERFDGWVENRGQWPEDVLFRASLETATVVARRDRLEVSTRAASGAQAPSIRIFLRDPGTNLHARGEAELPGLNHYFLGDDPAKWVRNVRRFERVTYPCIADGVDLVLHATTGRLEYDILAQPEADLRSLAFECAGSHGLTIDADGALIMHTPVGDLHQTPPMGEFQRVGEASLEASVGFRLVSDTSFGFDVQGDGLELPLRIDPGLVWSTYIGSSGPTTYAEYCSHCVSDPSGALYVTGTFNGSDFPTTLGSVQVPTAFGFGIFVSKFDSAGALVYSSVIGATNAFAEPWALGVTSWGSATVCGRIVNGGPFQNNFPTTPGAYDTVPSSLGSSGFVFRLSPQGDNLEFSTYLEGANDGSAATALAVTPAGSTVVCGSTESPAFPLTLGTFGQSYAGHGDGFVLRLNPSGSSLEWSTFLGGSNVDSPQAVELMTNGDIVVAGSTSSLDFPFTPGAYATSFLVVSCGTTFIARLSGQGDQVRWATALGGLGSCASVPRVLDLALDGLGGVGLTGSTGEATFPTTQGALVPAMPAFYPGELEVSYVARIDASGSNLLYSTFLGYGAHSRGIAMDASGIVTWAGDDYMGSVPTTPGAIPSVPQLFDVHIARFDPIGSRLFYSTRIPGLNKDSATGLVALAAHRVGLCGAVQPGFLTTPSAFDTTYNGGITDGFVAVADLFLEGIRQHGTPSPTCLGDCVMNATERPTSGSPTFGFYCSGAPPFSNGWLLLGTEQPQASVVQGAALMLDPAKRIVRIPVWTDYIGFVETRVPLTALPPGSTFAAQYVFRNPASCPGTGALVASHALSVGVQ